jgi:hypothetical protein
MSTVRTFLTVLLRVGAVSVYRANNQIPWSTTLFENLIIICLLSGLRNSNVNYLTHKGLPFLPVLSPQDKQTNVKCLIGQCELPVHSLYTDGTRVRRFLNPC